MCCSVTIHGEAAEHYDKLIEMGAKYNKVKNVWRLHPVFTSDLKELEDMGVEFKMNYMLWHSDVEES